MYLTERFDAAPLAWENFIGMRHVVEQIPMAEISAVPPATTIDSAPEMSVRALFNDTIDESMPSKPVAEQRRYWGARGVTLTEGAKVEDLVKSALAKGATDKVIYLYCHAEASAKDSDDSKLIFTGSQSVSLGQLSVFAPIEDVLESHPLVFINACESGELTPNFYDGFVPYFLAKGARGVIGTECKTPGPVRERVGEGVLRRAVRRASRSARSCSIFASASSRSTTTRSGCSTACTATPTPSSSPALAPVG